MKTLGLLIPFIIRTVRASLNITAAYVLLRLSKTKATLFLADRPFHILIYEQMTQQQMDSVGVELLHHDHYDFAPTH